MRCTQCHQREICLINKFLEDKRNIVTVEIQSCEFFQPIEYQQSLTSTNAEERVDPLERARLIKELDKKAQTEESTLGSGSPTETLICTSCHHPASKLITCENCGASICLECATLDVGSKKMLCPTCFEM